MTLNDFQGQFIHSKPFQIKQFWQTKQHVAALRDIFT